MNIEICINSYNNEIRNNVNEKIISMIKKCENLRIDTCQISKKESRNLFSFCAGVCYVLDKVCFIDSSNTTILIEKNNEYNKNEIKTISIDELDDELKTDILSFIGITKKHSRNNEKLKKIRNPLSTKKYKRSAISTGYSEIDFLVGGLDEGKMILITGQPASGKTALVLNVINNILDSNEYNNTAIGLFSLENPVENIMNRLISINSDIPINQLKKGGMSNNIQKYSNMYYKSTEKLNNWNLYIDDENGLTFENLKAKIYNIVARKKIEIIIIDHLELIVTQNGNKNSILRILKFIAQDLSITIIVTDSINKIEEQKFYSKQINSNVNNILPSNEYVDAEIMIDSYKILNAVMSDELHPMTNRFILVKNRNETTREVPFCFKPQINKFTTYYKKIQLII